MSLHYIYIEIPTQIYNDRDKHMVYIHDRLYTYIYPNNIIRGDTIIVNDNHIFGYDVTRIVMSEDDYIPIPVGYDLELDIFNQYNRFDQVVLDIRDNIKNEMLKNLTPFGTTYRNEKLYFLTTNPLKTYDKVKRCIENCSTMLISLDNDKMIYCDLDHKFSLDMNIISLDEDKCLAKVEWNNKIFDITYSHAIHVISLI